MWYLSSQNQKLLNMEHINISMCNSYIQSDIQTDIHTQREVGRDRDGGGFMEFPAFNTDKGFPL